MSWDLTCVCVGCRSSSYIFLFWRGILNLTCWTCLTWIQINSFKAQTSLQISRFVVYVNKAKNIECALLTKVRAFNKIDVTSNLWKWHWHEWLVIPLPRMLRMFGHNKRSFTESALRVKIQYHHTIFAVRAKTWCHINTITCTSLKNGWSIRIYWLFCKCCKSLLSRTWLVWYCCYPQT